MVFCKYGGITFYISILSTLALHTFSNSVHTILKETLSNKKEELKNGKSEPKYFR